MPWVRLDEDFSHHPKVAQVGPLGMAMQVAGLCYCNRHLTDGFIPRSIAATLLDFTGLAMNVWQGEVAGGGEDATWELVVGALLEVGLWKTAPGGFRIHDFHDYQPSKAEVLALRAKRSSAGKKGAQSRWQNDADDQQEQASAMASVMADAKQVPWQMDGKSDGKTMAKPCPVPVPVIDTSPSHLHQVEPSSAGDGDNQTPKKRHVPAHVLKALKAKAKSDGWEHFTAAMRAYEADGTVDEYVALAARFPSARPDQLPALADKGPLFRQFVERESVGA